MIVPICFGALLHSPPSPTDPSWGEFGFFHYSKGKGQTEFFLTFDIFIETLFGPFLWSLIQHGPATVGYSEKPWKAGRRGCFQVYGGLQPMQASKEREVRLHLRIGTCIICMICCHRKIMLLPISSWTISRVFLQNSL